MATGMVLWKTIAPVMLPKARVSLPSRTHNTELNFSGSYIRLVCIHGLRPSVFAPAYPIG